MIPNLAFTWQLTEVHGWGLVGVHTALYLADQGRPPLLLERPLMGTLRPENRERLQGLEGPYQQITAMADNAKGHTLLLKEFDVLHALGNGFAIGPASTRFRGRRNIGVIAYEDTRITPEVMARARQYDRIVVHSTYNKQLLEIWGFDNVGLAFQGIDPTEMVEAPPSGRFGDRFVVFSGGKLEFRKGQDIVLAAFRAFRQRHPEALLVTAWQNGWANVAMTMAESPLAPQPPRILPGPWRTAPTRRASSIWASSAATRSPACWPTAMPPSSPTAAKGRPTLSPWRRWPAACRWCCPTTPATATC